MKDISVLILDDEINILKSLQRLFNAESYGVRVTTDYREALELIEKEKIKVVISDQRMPGIAGTDFFKKVKEKHPAIIRILLTGYSDVQIAEDAINKGEVYRFLNKPWDDSALKAAVKESIDRFDLAEKNRTLTVEIRKQHEKLLVLYDKLKGMYAAQKEFSSTVSHELRTTLASIKMNIDVISSETAGTLTEDQKKFITKTKINIDRLSCLINDILNLSKLESGKAMLSFKLNKLNIIINEVVDTHKIVAEKKGLYVKTELSDNIPDIGLDRDKIVQTLINLVDNAIKFTEEGGITISSAVNPDQNKIVICVKDTGTGIRKEDYSKLFNKFQQLGNHAERQTGGTGLGLAICKEIIQQHKGEIWVESEYGKGSAFSFCLPIT